MGEPIRIAHIMGKWIGGGVEAVVMNYYRHIDHSKIQFDFICDSDSTDIPYDEIKSYGGKVILVPPYQKLFKYNKELEKVLKKGNYRIVHSHINTLSVFPLKIAKKVGVPIRIAHSHSTTNKREFKKNCLKQLLRKFSKVYATHYFACSELAGRWLFGNRTFEEGKVFILNNAIEVEKFKYNKAIRDKIRKELGIDENTLAIGHVGRFVTQKNHKFLINIFNELHKQNSNTVLLLVGKGPLMNDIEEKVKQLKIDKCVFFLGQRNDVNELYQAMDVFLLPSLYEGLPVVGIEAQVAGNICFFSDKMTKETKILDSTVIMSINDLPKKWAEKILILAKDYRNPNLRNQIEKSNFNIIIEGKRLENKYFSYLEKESKCVE